MHTSGCLALKYYAPMFLVPTANLYGERAEAVDSCRPKSWLVDLKSSKSAILVMMGFPTPFLALHTVASEDPADAVNLCKDPHRTRCRRCAS